MLVHLDSAAENYARELGLRAETVPPTTWNGWVRPTATAEAVGDFLDAWRLNDPNGTWGWVTEVGDKLVISDSDTDDPTDSFPSVGVDANGVALYDLTGWCWVIAVE